jgi:Arc/MetJ-type ribon-helix-helix transcriptional regulator
MDTEKVCVNLPAAELGKIDVLVAQGLYSSRTDLIRAGIRRTLEDNIDAVQRVATGSAGIGYMIMSRAELMDARAAKKKLKYLVVGVLRIEKSITPELAEETIEKIQIFGSLKGPPAVIDRLGDRVIHGFGIS